jgi:2-(1,2-epoxy-1,2-dihydrophenyl)acetyl-CoA isomerase
MKSASSLQLLRTGATARILLSRPERGNTIDLQMAEDLRWAAAECEANHEIRCVLITGQGKLFCGGGDVHSFAAAGDGAPKLLEAITANLHVAISTFAQMNKPLVTIINGPAAGAGVSLAALGDIAIASRAAHFTLAYTAIGLTPDGGASWLLPRLIGLRRAQELILTNRRLSADEAAEIGLITRAVDEDQLEGDAEALVSALEVSATAALGRARRLLMESYGSSLTAQMEREAQSISESMATAAGREGVASFLERRLPIFPFT